MTKAEFAEHEHLSEHYKMLDKLDRDLFNVTENPIDEVTISIIRGSNVTTFKSISFDYALHKEFADALVPYLRKFRSIIAKKMEEL